MIARALRESKGHFSKVAHDKKPQHPPIRAVPSRNVDQHQEFSKQFYVQDPEKSTE